VARRRLRSTTKHVAAFININHEEILDDQNSSFTLDNSNTELKQDTVITGGRV